MKVLIIYLHVATALAAVVPIVARNNTAPDAKTLPPVIFVDGRRVDLRGGPTALKSNCTVDDDILTCAQKTAANWKLSATGNSVVNHMSLSEIYDYNGQGQLTGSQIDFDYKIAFSDCHLSDPVFTDHQGLFQCNSGGPCKETLTFSSSSTQMNMDSFHIGTSVQAGINVGIFSAQASVTADWMQSWSNSTTYTNTVSRELDMNPGDVCAPATVQFYTQCNAALTVVSPDGTDNVNVTFPDISGQYVGLESLGNLCNPNFSPVHGDDKWKAVCKALTPQGVAMDVDSITGGSAYTFQGCMAS